MQHDDSFVIHDRDGIEAARFTTRRDYQAALLALSDAEIEYDQADRTSARAISHSRADIRQVLAPSSE